MAIRITSTTITFTAPENAVSLVSDIGDWQKNPVPLKTGESITLEIPRAAYLEYAYLDAAGKLFADPDNLQQTKNNLGPHNRAVYMPGYKPGDALEEPGEIARGNVERLAWSSKFFSGTRRAYLYTPPNASNLKNLPIFFVQDGVAYLRIGQLGQVMDVLLSRNLVRPAAFMFLEPQDRFNEYWLNDHYLDFVIDEALPLAQERAPISDEPKNKGMWGASMGGLISMYAGLKHSDVFGMVVSQSGALQADVGGAAKGTRPDGQREWLVEQFSELEKLPLRVSMDCGQLEWLLGSNRRMAAALFDRKYVHQYFELPSGHNWTTWRNGLAKHLLFMLGK